MQADRASNRRTTDDAAKCFIVGLYTMPAVFRASAFRRNGRDSDVGCILRDLQIHLADAFDLRLHRVARRELLLEGGGIGIAGGDQIARSEERRVGKECRS